MPELPSSFLSTERMDKLYAGMISSRVINICAPAGYGKTMLAVSFFKRQTAEPLRICWYRLDPEDKSLPVFMTHLMDTLLPPESPRFAGSRNVLQEYAGPESSPLHIVAMICQELWSHHNRSDHTRTCIVFDDFQNVAQTPEISDIVRFMLNNLPPSCAIFVLSRANTIIFTEKQKLEHSFLDIGTEDLAFSRSEISDLLLHFDQTGFNKKAMDVIRRKTEGWIAGIILLVQAFKNKELNIAAIENGKLGHEEALFRYLSLEVLKSVGQDTRDALIRLAVLQDFSENEASEIFGVANIKELMARSMGFGLFIQKIHGDPVVYRFHSLFREFLLYILKQKCYAEQIDAIHLKAAAYYLGQESYARAAEHLAHCENAVPAAEMVTKAGFNKYLIGETAQLKVWLDLLPEDMFRDNPVLLMFKAQLLPNSKQRKAVEPLKNLLHQSLLDNNPVLYFNAATVLIYILTCSNDMRGLREITTGLSWQLENAPEELHHTLVILDMVHSLADERFPAAAAQSKSIRYDLLPEDSQWLYFILSSIIYHCLGELDDAERCMQTALALQQFKNVEPARGFILLFLSIAISLKNEQDHLKAYLSEIIAIGEKYDYDYLTANGRRLSAFERYVAFDTESAAEMLDYAAFHYRRMNNPVMAAACRLLQRLWPLHPGSSGHDLEEARRDMALIRKAGPGMMITETSLSVFGAIAREAGDFQLAERSLLSTARSAKTKKARQALCGTYFHLSRLYFATNDPEKARCYLRQALELAVRNRYYMFWDIHLPTLTEMALRAVRYGYSADFAQELLGKYYDGSTVKYLVEKIKTIAESRITEFSDDFVSRCRSGQTEQLYLIKASLFGKPEILVNGIRIPDAEWKTKKVKGLLEYLLLNSGQTVSKDTLLYIFWPESDGKSAMVSLRTALYQLRKTLAKYNIPVSGNNAFIHETPGGLQIRNSEALELDLTEFLRLNQELNALTKNIPNPSGNPEILEQLVTLYRGDLMDSSDYGDLAFVERERCKAIFEDACLKLGIIYAGRGEPGRAEEILRRALAIEPYSENICLELLRLHISQGMRSKAVNLYYRFKKRFEQDLDIKIDSKLTLAIQKFIYSNNQADV